MLAHVVYSLPIYPSEKKGMPSHLFILAHFSPLLEWNVSDVSLF